MESDVRAQSPPSQEEEGPLNPTPQGITFTEPDNLTLRLQSLTSDTLSSRSCAYILTRKILDSRLTTAFMTTITIYALFGDDIRMAATSKSADNVFFSLASVCLVLFSAEIVATFWVKPSYRWSFNFYLDVISTISLIPDIGWAWQRIIGTSDASSTSQINQVQNAGKLSRTGARTSRVVRIVRLIRIIRLVKLYKSARSAMERQNSLKVVPESDYSIPEESKIGRKLSDLTTKRVILIVMTLLIILPLFDVTFYVSPYTSWECGGKQLKEFYGTPAFDLTREVFIDYHSSDIRPLIFLSLTAESRSVVWQTEKPADLRVEEAYYIVEGANVAVFDTRYDTRMTAELSICRTVFICIVLSLGAIYLTKDANTLVIEPIEKMIDKVRKIAKNPVGILEDDLLDVYDIEGHQALNPNWWQRLCCLKANTQKELETSALESAIMKIGALLAISFGEAGARIIGENISKGDSVNPMLEGKKVVAIFGFCDIRNFTDTTEVLQEGVMTFVNEIAHIVHHTVDHHLGMANKNIGDAFMIVWKFPETLYLHDNQELEVNPDSYIVRNTADLSIISFLKILSKINRNTAVVKYRNHPELRKIPGYSVRMGFALHSGWAIEGAIGSALKIDASYLSPHVNIVLRMEELTKLYAMPILISGAVVRIASEYVRSRCRHLDTVQTPSGVIIRLYTYDVDLANISPSHIERTTREHTKAKHREMLLKVSNPDFLAYKQFEESRHLSSLPRGVTQDYVHLYNRAMEAFEQGLWGETRRVLDDCLRIKPVDVPSKVILTYVETQGNQAPNDWLGCRPMPR